MVAGSTKKMRIRFGLALTRRTNLYWRPMHDDFQRVNWNVPPNYKGYPQFHEEWDLANSTAKGNRTFQSVRNMPRLRDDWTVENCHEMKGKFRFALEGQFHDVERLEKEIHDAALKLSLVGWFKARKNFAVGHLQGDVYAISTMKQWIQEHHLSKEAGTIRSDRVTDENWGIAEPLTYKRLVSIKDWRVLHKKVLHRDVNKEKIRLRQLEADTDRRRQAAEEKQYQIFSQD